MATPGSTPAHSAAENTLLSPATPDAHECTPELFDPERALEAHFLEHITNPSPISLLYVDLRPFVHARPPLVGPGEAFSSLLDRIVQPYGTVAFRDLLERHNLSAAYPDLVRNLSEGFPLGRLPVLDSTVIIPNHPSASIERESTLDYIQTELRAGRMDGPFSREEMELVCRGPFFASPLIVASSDQGPGLEPKKRVCRNLSKGDSKAGIPAVNDYIDKADFLTRFDMPSKMADLVSHQFFLLSFPFALVRARAPPKAGRSVTHPMRYLVLIPRTPALSSASGLRASHAAAALVRGPSFPSQRAPLSFHLAIGGPF
jgi:hypothetical protein